jgi:hypothetical protein
MLQTIQGIPAQIFLPALVPDTCCKQYKALQQKYSFLPGFLTPAANNTVLGIPAHIVLPAWVPNTCCKPYKPFPHKYSFLPGFLTIAPNNTRHSRAHIPSCLGS